MENKRQNLFDRSLLRSFLFFRALCYKQAAPTALKGRGEGQVHHKSAATDEVNRIGHRLNLDLLSLTARQTA